MDKYLQNPLLIRQQGEAGYNKASIHFTKKNNTDNIKKLYDNIMEKNINED